MKNLLVIGYVWPEPTSSAAGQRMLQLLESFLAEGYKITFATTASKTDFIVDLPSMGIASEKIELNNPSFDHFLKKIHPEIVIFDRFMMEEQFGWRVSEICPDAVKILNTEDLHFLRKARHEAVKKETELTPEILFSETSKREVASIYRCDLSLIISEVEMELLKTEFGVPKNLLFYLPFMLKMPLEAGISNLPSFEDREHFMSIGNFFHEPNWDAVLNLKQQIWPGIKSKLPEAEIHIFGAYHSQKVHELHNPKEGFLIKGRAGSSIEVLKKSRVLLAPLRFGAGIKGKFTDAFQAGTPSVTTNLGAEGMTQGLSWNGFLADKPEDFISSAVKLYKDKKLWEQSQQKGFQLLENFSEKIHRKRLFERLEDLQRNLETHRNRNFTGKMLQQHLLSSTKYLSRYIEIKTKLQDQMNQNEDRP